MSTWPSLQKCNSEQHGFHLFLEAGRMQPLRSLFVFLFVSPVEKIDLHRARSLFPPRRLSLPALKLIFFPLFFHHVRISQSPLNTGDFSMWEFPPPLFGKHLTRLGLQFMGFPLSHLFEKGLVPQLHFSTLLTIGKQWRSNPTGCWL